jgi:membrane-associated phospholipid phosphatase
MLAALSVLGLATAVAVADITAVEIRTFETINQLDDLLEPLLWLPMQLGSLFGPVVVAVASWLAWRQWRPAIGALVVGLFAWQAAKLVKQLVDRGRPVDELGQIVTRSGTPTDGLGFVSGHTSVAFALATVVSPWLSSTGRVVAYGLAVVVGLARIHVGAHLPLDTIGGAALGMAFGFAYRLVVGTPTVSAAGPSGET